MANAECTHPGRALTIILSPIILPRAALAVRKHYVAGRIKLTAIAMTADRSAEPMW